MHVLVNMLAEPGLHRTASIHSTGTEPKWGKTEGKVKNSVYLNFF